MGKGLQMILKQHGRMVVKNNEGKKVVWVWDYNKQCARLEHEMSTQEKKDSLNAKFQQLNKK